MAEPLPFEEESRAFTSVAVDDDATALFANPAGLGIATTRAFLMSGTDFRLGEAQDSLLGMPDWTFSAAYQVSRWGIGYRRLNPGGAPRGEEWLLGSSVPLWSWGRLGIRWRRLRLSGATTWRTDAGLLIRPTDWLSFGMVAEDATQSRLDSLRLLRSWRVGIGLRPLPGKLRERLTLWIDAEGPEGKAWRQWSRWRLGIRTEIFDGFSLVVGYELPARSWRDEARFMGGGSYSQGMVRTEYFGLQPVKGRPALLRYVTQSSREWGRWYSPVRFLARVRIRGRLADEPTRALPLPIPYLSGQTRRSVEPILRSLATAREDPRIRGVLLEIGPVWGGSLLQEIRDEIARIRAAGKPVVAYLEDGGSHNGYGLAAACDRIVLAPRAALYLLGIRTDILYYGEALDSLGIGFERITSGPYKSAFERFERSRASPGFREQMESLLDEAWDQWLEAVSQGRGLSRDSLETLADGRVLPAEEAVAAGLVDSLGTREDAEGWLAELAGLEGRRPFLDPGRIRYRRERWGPRPVVAVYHMSGQVVLGRSARPPFGEIRMGARTVAEDLRRLGRTWSVKAIVLRVDSGGGLGMAGDLIRRAVLELKKTGKPVIVSMGRVAASAAYHFSAPADVIFAEPGTYTGSIGVLAVRPDQAGLLARLRIHPETFERGRFMGLWTMVRPLTEEERRLAQAWIDADYRRFLEDVAEDRGMTPEEVHEIAQGRVWTGRQALELGLVDELGGLYEAVEKAKEMAGLGPEAEVRHIWTRRPRLPLPLRLVLGGEASWWESLVLPAADLPEGAELEAEPGVPPGILPLEISPLARILVETGF
jgi:protease-4